MYSPRSRYSSPTVLGISERWERVLCYVGLWVTGLIFLLIETKNATVRRHAVQSITVFGTLSIVAWLAGFLSHIPLLGFFFGIAGVAVGAVTFLAWLLLMIAGYLSPDTFIPRRTSRYF